MGDFSIQISSNLINRLTNNDEKLKKTTKKLKPKIVPQPQHSQTKVDQKHKNTAGTGWLLQPPLPTYTEVDAIQSVLKESERVGEKLQKQEEEMVQEVTERARILRDKEFKLPPSKPMPCFVETDACMACYKENASDPLRCAHLTKSLADCARRVRQLVYSATM